MSKYIDAEKLIAEIERLHKAHSGKYGCDEVALNLEYLEDFITSLQQEQPEVDLEREIRDYFSKWDYDTYNCVITMDNNLVATLSSILNVARHFYELGRAGTRASIECLVRVYPELDEEPRPWVSLCGKGISMISFRDLPELESLGFKDYDTAIVTIARKEESK